MPGAGKTMLAAIAIDSLNRTARSDNIEVTYVFCKYKGQSDQSAPSLLAALLKQLVQSRPNIAAPVTRMYDEHSSGRNKPILGDIFGALQSVCSNLTTAYMVVDALDECANDDGARGLLIKKLFELQAKTDVRLLFTSRLIPDIIQKFQSYPKLEVRATKEDVGRFVAGQIPRLPNCIRRSDELKHAVVQKIVEAVDGM